MRIMSSCSPSRLADALCVALAARSPLAIRCSSAPTVSERSHRQQSSRSSASASMYSQRKLVNPFHLRSSESSEQACAREWSCSPKLRFSQYRQDDSKVRYLFCTTIHSSRLTTKRCSTWVLSVKREYRCIMHRVKNWAQVQYAHSVSSPPIMSVTRVQIESIYQKPCIRTGDRATVVLRFIKHAEWLRPGDRFLFREGRVSTSRALGQRDHSVEATC